jgi:hypothetical protein
VAKKKRRAGSRQPDAKSDGEINLTTRAIRLHSITRFYFIRSDSTVQPLLDERRNGRNRS